MGKAIHQEHEGHEEIFSFVSFVDERILRKRGELLVELGLLLFEVG